MKKGDAKVIRDVRGQTVIKDWSIGQSQYKCMVNGREKDVNGQQEREP